MGRSNLTQNNFSTDADMEQRPFFLEIDLRSCCLFIFIFLFM